MKSERITAVKMEMERLSTRIAKLEMVMTNAPGWDHPIESGAVRRASMDLTRALADLRRSNYR